MQNILINISFPLRISRQVFLMCLIYRFDNNMSMAFLSSPILRTYKQGMSVKNKIFFLFGLAKMLLPDKVLFEKN